MNQHARAKYLAAQHRKQRLRLARLYSVRIASQLLRQFLSGYENPGFHSAQRNAKHGLGAIWCLRFRTCEWFNLDIGNLQRIYGYKIIFLLRAAREKKD